MSIVCRDNKNIEIWWNRSKKCDNYPSHSFTPTLRNILHFHCIKFEIHPRSRTQENDQKPHFWLFGSPKKAFLRFLNDPAWGIWQPNCQHHLVKWKYAISSRSDERNSRKWPKTSFLAVWIIQKGIFLIFEWSSMGDRRAHLSRSFSIIIIWNLKSIPCT